MHPLDFLHPSARRWFEATFREPTAAQRLGWPTIAQGRSTLLLAPTGSGKTLAAFLAAINRLLFSTTPPKKERCRVLYVSPLKALAVDVHENLEVPIAGIRRAAEEDGVALSPVTTGVRSGDTPSAERARLARTPPDVLITTPESLYLILTSNARETLASVETVIIDEIHSMVATKRGAHLFLSLERLEALRTSEEPLQRIGLSATQRPLEEVARLLGGFDDEGRARPVEIVNAGKKKPLDLSIQVPVEDMARLEQPDGEEENKSIWPSIHPRLVELIRAHQSTLVFVNNRALAERLAGALNELAGEAIAFAHHGSIAKEARRSIESRLKAGELPALVATSSLELGIDMGAIDLVIQIEAPPSVASGLQRIGRAGHQVGAVSKGVIFPKFRADLLACAAAAERMIDGEVEETYYPRNPLDVLAQQIVATVAGTEGLEVDRLFALVRRAAPFAELPRSSFDGVLDMLSGRYPSDRFADLRPRVTWDRKADVVTPRQGAKRIAVVNGGTIPDRGLYGVFLAGAEEGAKSRRVGELDEEMVFESRPGDVFLLGASSWRIEEIDHDRVLVSPAPGEPGRMPFWRGDRPGRPAELGRAIGALARRLLEAPRQEAERTLIERRLDQRAAKNLLDYLEAQREATGALPTDDTVLLERFVDEVGDWRVCLLTPFGARVHAPWATAVATRLGHLSERDVDLMWTDDGIAFRLPATDQPPEPSLFFPPADELRDLVVRGLGDTALFAARFRENAGRSLLLTKRRPGQRTPLWATRRRAADLLGVAVHFPDFPVVLETYRECLLDAFDLESLREILEKIEHHQIRVASVHTKAPSPFASALLFTYVANFIYDTDAPLAERRAHALSIDHGQLRELLGEAELRELLDPAAIERHEQRLQHRDARFPVKHPDGLHDLLLSIGDLTREEIALRSEGDPSRWIEGLVRAGRALELRIGGEPRIVAVEDAARYRDALGVELPAGIPEPLLQPAPGALTELVARFARTHGPFDAGEPARRFRVGPAAIELALQDLLEEDRVVRGAFLPGGTATEWSDPDVLRAVKRMSLAELKKQIEPQPQAALARFLLEWQGLTLPRSGLDATLDVIEQLQGAPLLASALESEILPARISGYTPAMLDELCAAGELVWRGLERVGRDDGRIALYLTDDYARLAPPPSRTEERHELRERIRALLEERGALFYSELVARTKAFSGDLVQALWDMVFAGEVTNDTLAPLRSLRAGDKRKSQPRRGRFRSRRQGPPGSEGRWSLLPNPEHLATATERRTALATRLLDRYGVLTREAIDAESIPGGFSTVYPVLKAMEERGRVRRGWFLQGLSATQFAQPGADDRLRALATVAGARPTILAATDPANAYGAALPWPSREGARPQRAAGAQVILQNGELLAWLGRTETTLLTFTEDRETVARALADWARTGERKAVLIAKVDGAPVDPAGWAKPLEAAGFRKTGKGWLIRRFDP